MKPETEEKYLFQIVSAENGQRSEPFIATWNSISSVIEETQEKGEDVNIEDYILLVAIISGTETRIPGNPLIKIKTLLSLNTNQDED